MRSWVRLPTGDGEGDYLLDRDRANLEDVGNYPTRQSESLLGRLTGQLYVVLSARTCSGGGGGSEGTLVSKWRCNLRQFRLSGGLQGVSLSTWSGSGRHVAADCTL